MTGPYGIPYEELAMQQKEAEESMPYTMRDVRASIVKLDPKDRVPILLALDSAQGEIESLTAALAKAEERCRELSDILLALVNESTNPTDDGSSFDACVSAARAALEGE